MAMVVQRAAAPGEGFYRTYTPAQIDAIAVALEERAEFPYELTYLGGGSELWNAAETAPGGNATVLSDMGMLMTRHAEALLALAPTRSVRVVDLGPGTARPVCGLLRHLLDRSRLEGYCGIDVSPELLELAGKRLSAEFPEHAHGFDLRLGDFNGPDLDQVLSAVEGRSVDGPVQFAILAGGTLFNFPDPDRVLRHVRQAMRADDVLVATLRVDTEVDRPPFMDEVSVGGPYKPQQLAGLELLGVDRSCVPETGFDPERSEIFVRVRFTEPVAVEFAAAGRERTVRFAPDDTVVVWRYLYLDPAGVEDRLARNGFNVRLLEHGATEQMVLVAASPMKNTTDWRVA